MAGCVEIRESDDPGSILINLPRTHHRAVAAYA